jgi:hypothetical protein
MELEMQQLEKGREHDNSFPFFIVTISLENLHFCSMLKAACV